MTEFARRNPNMLSPGIDRRRWLTLFGGATGAVAVGGWLAACDSGAENQPAATDSAPSTQTSAVESGFTHIVDGQGEPLDVGAATRIFPGIGVNQSGRPEILRPIFRVETGLTLPNQVGHLAAVAVYNAGVVQELGGLPLEFWARRSRLAETPLAHMRAFDPAEHVQDDPLLRRLIYMQGVTVAGPINVEVPVPTGRDTEELVVHRGITFDESRAGGRVRVEEAFGAGVMAMRLIGITATAAAQVLQEMTAFQPKEIPLVKS